jgi:pyruvate/2-oxoglutarate dehydrogenase complex dihydrolipoamide acyltransferase (E2) component
MKQEIILPEMGESVLEATVIKWLVNIGDEVKEDDSILEVATDKVDSEIPSPITGKIIELCVKEDEIAKIGSVIAYIETDSQLEKPKTAMNKKTANSKKTMTNKFEFQLPEMGESVHEATVSNILKQVGDMVKEDENLLEVSTDKVDTELPSPVNGKIIEINVNENDVVKVGHVLLLIETNEAFEQTSKIPEIKETTQEHSNSLKTGRSENKKNQVIGSNNGFFSPLVKRIAKIEKISEHELSKIAGNGLNNRLTKEDILSYLKNRSNQSSQSTMTITGNTGNFPHNIEPVRVNYDPSRVTIETMSTMRKGIAKHMVQSLYTAPHVFSIHEVNMKKIWDWRNKVKDTFKKKHNTNLTFTHIIMEMISKSIQKNPRINSSIIGDKVIIRHDINLGMAVGFTAKNGDNGLMVPVIRNIDELNLTGIAKRASELTNKVREGKVSPDDTAGGTFTVTNVGTFGTEVGLGIINQPQVAILSLGTIVKKPIVTDDNAILIAPMMKIALCYDHRVVDGMLAGNFLQTLQNLLENFDSENVII